MYKTPYIRRRFKFLTLKIRNPNILTESERIYECSSPGKNYTTNSLVQHTINNLRP